MAYPFVTGNDLMTPENFHEWLKRERKRAKLTLQGLGQKAGVSHASIVRLENGERDPSRDMVTKLAPALDASLDEALMAAGFLLQSTKEIITSETEAALITIYRNGVKKAMTHDELPDGWLSFIAALPPKLYARFVARAEREGSDLLTESAYLLAYALDNAPSPSAIELEPLSEERMKALQERMRQGALAVGTKVLEPEDDASQENKSSKKSI